MFGGINMARFILDTNIIIPLEDSSKVLEPILAKLLRKITSDHQVFYHPATISDINRDADISRRSISLSRLEKYSKLPCSTFLESSISEVLGSGTENDKCDNEILFSLFKNEYDYLITEDRGLHKKAKRLDISSRVFYIQQAFSRFVESFDRSSSYSSPVISVERLSDISVGEDIYESLKYGYSGFGSWYEKSQREGRSAWVVRSVDKKISAICIVKEESNVIFGEECFSLKGRVLKLCTFKVAALSQGRRLGEMLLKKAFFEAFRQEYRYVYMTIRDGEQPHLKDLIEKFGFALRGKAEVEGALDEVYVRKVCPETKTEIAEVCKEPLKFYPVFTSKGCGGCILPVQPTFHKILFPDFERQSDLFYNPDQSVSNSIRQAYISNSNIKPLDKGSVIFFYRTQDIKELTGIGVVEYSFRSYDKFEILKSVKKITVYNDYEISEKSKKGALVVVFYSVFQFSDKIDLAMLNSLGVKGNIQTARLVSEEVLQNLIEVAGAKNYISTYKA
jgi:hypothetical protein